MGGGTDMKKKYKLNEIDCANCAMKLEEAVKAVDGVTSAKVNYMMQKLTFEAWRSAVSWNLIWKSLLPEAVEHGAGCVCVSGFLYPERIPEKYLKLENGGKPRHGENYETE